MAMVPKYNKEPLPDYPELHTVGACSNVYIRKGTRQSIIDYFDQTFGAKFVVLDHTANENIFRVRYLVVESDRYPEKYHYVCGKDIGWVVREGLQHDSKTVRYKLDNVFDYVYTHTGPNHDLECRVSVFLTQYFARMLEGLVESADKDNLCIVENLYRWIHNLSRVTDTLVHRHMSCRCQHHDRFIRRAYGRLLDAIAKSGITMNQAPNELSALCIFEDSDYFQQDDHSTMKWPVRKRKSRPRRFSV